ncbi:MAG: transglycosylase domain-containing protein, partial [Actinobacteria bacterium]|nr:transglycosylase domain-containing protein [Actinomycetota bacterium]
MKHRAIAAVLGLALLAQACGLPQLADYQARGARLPQTSFLYAADGSLITELHAEQDRIVVPYSAMPQSIKDAAVAIEDQRFWSHYGVDLRAIVRAAYIDATAGRIVEGGSTITQQLVKNLYVGNDDTIQRKVDEAALAWQLEQQLTKDQILAKYLNTVYFGEGAYGVQAASKAYFGKDAIDLSVAQSALLAGLIASPNDYDPFEHPAKALQRRGEVLSSMLQLGDISAAAYQRAEAKPLDLHPGLAQQRYQFPYFVDYAFRWFLTTKILPPATFGRPCPPSQPYRGGCPDRFSMWYEGGLRIATTIDPRLQEEADRAVNSVLTYPSDPYGALTAIDPRDGYVRAMVGGRNFWGTKSGIGRVNLATGGSTGRQAGSSFKPFALVAALEKGISPDTYFSAPSSIDIPLDNGQVWHVTNAEPGGFGVLTLEQATIESVNTVYAQVIQRVGAQSVVDVARKMGIRCCTRESEPKTPLLPYYSAVLGSNEVNTLEMASAYGTFAAGGYHVEPIPISSITDAQGHTLWEADEKPKLAIDPRVISVADGILQKVVLYGTGTGANIGRPQIGKTGTEDNYTNAWFAGAVPQLSVAVWVGFPKANISMQPPTTRITVFGGTWPASIWRAFMLAASRRWPPRQFPTPSVSFVSVAVDVTQDPYCLPNGFTPPGNIETLHFIDGTQPTKTCRTPTSAQLVTVPSVIGLRQSLAESRLRSAG